MESQQPSGLLSSHMIHTQKIYATGRTTTFCCQERLETERTYVELSVPFPKVLEVKCLASFEPTQLG